MTTQVLLVLLAVITGLVSPAGAWANFSAFRDPAMPGERMATAILDLKGLPLNKVSVSVVFSDKQDAVQNAFDIRKRNPATYSSGKATLEDLGNGKARATFIFPHRDHPGDGGKIYPTHTKVFYAWAEDFVPTGATSTLTINSPVRSFDVPRFLILAYMGDSYAAGEGAPNENAGVGKAAKWDDKDCHRSKKSGGVRAIEKLKASRPEWAIRYVNVTCSGAELDDFITADTRPGLIGQVGWSKPAQFAQVQAWLKDNHRKVVDILLTDGGGNDVGFAPVGTSALTAFFANVSEDDGVKKQVRDGLSGLAGGYEAINAVIKSEFYGFAVGRVVWVNYPNPLNDQNGRLCSPRSGGNNPFDCWGALEKQISDADFRFLQDTVFVGLNSEVSKAATKYQWDLVDVSKRSLNNGLCNCNAPYFNTLGQALAIQGDIQGTMHPNASGFRHVYRDPVFQQLERSIRLWHDELSGDAKARELAVAKAKEAAMAKARAAVDAASRKPPKPIFKQKSTLPENIKREVPRLDPEDLRPVPESNDDSTK
jgi:hypothetical protein